MELNPVSDRELWVAYEIGQSWQIPIYCDPYSSEGPLVTHYVIRPALPLLAAPHAALEKHFTPHDLSGSKKHWVIEAPLMEKLARKAPGITPAYYLRWEEVPPRTELESQEVKPDTIPAWNFLRHVSIQSGLDFATIKVVWMAITRWAPDWLLNKQQPIYCSFMNLFPVPFRVNWKEIMLARYPKCAPAFNLPEPARDEYLRSSGFIEDLGSTDLIAMDGKSKHFRWSLECVPTDHWYQCVREAEGTRLGVGGKTRYTRYYETRIRNHMRHILSIFGAWIRQMCVPVARVAESPRTGSEILVPSRKYGVLPQRHNEDIAPIMVSSDEVSVKRGRHQPLEEKAARLLSLPAVLHGVEDVRGREELGEPGGKLDKPADTGG